MRSEDFAVEFEAAFRRLWVIAFAITHDRSAAEDVVQEAAVVGLEKRDELRDGTSFVAWMSQIVRFVALNRTRKDKRARPVEPEKLEAVRARSGAKHAALTKSGNVAAFQEHFDDDVVKGLRDLAPIARACLLLRTVEELEYAEIARLLDVPEGTAMSHVHRARAQMRAALAGREESP
jgi:RNA polymerase sigma-70 factor (ECF subfamily)